MHKITILLFLVFSSIYLNSQTKLDSLYAVWQDKTQTDSVRTVAFKKYIWDGFLFDKPYTAFNMAEELISFSKSNQFRKAEAEAYNIQGVSFWIKANYLEAINYYQRSLKIREEIGDKKGISASLYNIGNIYIRQGNYLQALDYHQRSLKIEQEIDNREGIALSLGIIGLIYSEQLNYPKALEYYERSLKIHEEIGDTSGAGTTLANIGLNYKRQGDLSKALDYHLKALKIREENGNKLFIASSLENIGSIYIEQGLYHQAITECQRSLSLSEGIGAIEEQKRSCECLYSAYKLLRNSNKALEYHEQMLVLSDSLRSEETSKKLQQMEFSKQVLADSLVQVEKDLKVEIAHQKEVREKDKNNNLALGASIFFLLLAGGFYSRWRYVKKSKAVIEKERDRSESLLLNILPSETAAELKENGKVTAEKFELVSVMFTDFKKFTEYSNKMPPDVVVKNVNFYFSEFDRIIDKYGLEKIKTIGDAYMCASGLHKTSNDNIESVIKAGLEIIDFMKNPHKTKDPDIVNFEIRVGINTGTVVAGVVGIKKFAYDIWGDTVNIASRMESNSEPGRINISEYTYELIKDLYNCEYRGETEIKNKGLMKMYFLNSSKG